MEQQTCSHPEWLELHLRDYKHSGERSHNLASLQANWVTGHPEGGGVGGEEAAVEEEEEVRMGSGLSGRPWLLSVRVGSSVCARHVSSADREPAGFSDVDEEACAKQTQLSSITTTSNNMIYQHKQHLLLLNHWLLKTLKPN